MARGTILYIGGFELPDKNAAAQRVVGNAKALRELGYSVIFLNRTCDSTDNKLVLKEHYGFPSYETKRKTDLRYLIGAKDIMKFAIEHAITHIIAYNYPGVALNNLQKVCKRRGIYCYADVTEWYKPHGNILKKLIMSFDIFMRMKIAHFKMDGIIAISRYLNDYYLKKVSNVVLIPPLVDINEEKWAVNAEALNKNKVSLVYAGSPSQTKERLDLIVLAVEKIALKYPVTLYIAGITKNEYIKAYKQDTEISDNIIFFGRLMHTEVIDLVKKSNWSIIIRDNNRVVQAGFPTKLVESISCGTPVISNKFSNIGEYLNNTNSIIVDDNNNLTNAIAVACGLQLHPNTMTFDYRKYLDRFEKLLTD